ncbi:MAG: TIR domain-containing protein [Rhodopirellula sp.]|nr:TIR domain-containing protein [Rhodopirellula sp.]
MSNTGTSNYFVHTLLRARDWQHRPQLDAVIEWWADGGRGVCALVGMGGAGKTAIADRFLNDLLDGTNPSHQRGNPPESVFVYSFYDDDKPENFFRHLQIWLESTSAPDKQKSPTQLMYDIQQHQGLIILDGLEKVQESGARGGFGRLTSPSLRELLNHIACGSARELSVLVTSRFPLNDLRDSQPRFFHTIAVDQIDVVAGVTLLRERGVRGTDVQLAPIVEHCGQHALTIDLAGGYIKEYGHGDPTTPLNLGTAEELKTEADQEPDDDKRAVLKQGIRFARIAHRYREAMLNSDEAALALLERICLFRLAVDCQTLAAIFTGPDAEKVSGKALASLDAYQLQKKLDWLVSTRIVERADTSSSESTQTTVARYSLHPAVRDGFMRGVNAETERTGHGAVLRQLATILQQSPGQFRPSDHATLDLLEEIIYHTLRVGLVSEAVQIYWQRLGGYEHLVWYLGAYERGDRVCRTIYSYRENLVEEELAILLHQWHYFLKDHGQLRESESCLRQSFALNNRHGRKRSSIIDTMYLSEVLVLRGELSESSQCATRGLRTAEETDNSQAQCNLWSFQAYALGLKGKTRESHQQFVHSDELAQSLGMPLAGSASGKRGIWFAIHLVLLGRLKQAKGWNERNFDTQQTSHGDACPDLPRCKLVLAWIECQRHRFTSARDALDWGNVWASERNAQEVSCWSSVVQARIELSESNLQRPIERSGFAKQLAIAEGMIINGLKIARDCGYGLYHIDLLLERARLHLLRGDAGAALDDIEVALDTGIPANEETGQVELLAANHEQCGYAWAIPASLQLRAEALLLQAAQACGSVADPGFVIEKVDCCLRELDVVGDELREAAEAKLARKYPNATLQKMVDKRPEKARTAIQHLIQQLESRLPEDIGRTVTALRNFFEQRIDRTNIDKESPRCIELIDCLRTNLATFRESDGFATAVKLRMQAVVILNEALELWQPLYDPEPERDDQNFKLNGKEYNYRAAKTHQIMTDLKSGILTRYTLTQAQPDEVEDSSHHSPDKTNNAISTTEDHMPKRFDVALSFPGEHRTFVEEVAKSLSRSLTREKVFYDRFYEAELARPNLDTYLQHIYHNDVNLVVVVLCKEYDEKEWCGLEFRAIRDLIKKRRDDEIMFVRVAQGDVKGVFGIDGYVDAQNRPASEIAGVIRDRLKIVQNANP